MRQLFLLLLFFFSFSLFSQQTKTDSLLKVISKSKEDTSKVKTLNNLFLELEYENPAKAEEYLKSALLLAQKLNDKKGQILTYKHLGFLFEDKANYQEAIKNYSIGLKISNDIGDKKGQLSSFNNIGIICANQGNYSEALSNYLKAETISKEIANKQAFASITNNIGNIYKYQGNYPEAIKYHLKSLKMQEELGNTKGVAASYNNIGMINMSQEKFNEAFINYAKALELVRKINDKRAIGGTYNNIANVYSDKKDFKTALLYHDSCLKVLLEIEDKAGLANSYGNIGNIFKEQNNLSKAIENHLHAIELYKETNNPVGLSNIYNNIGDAYMKQANYATAKKYFIESQNLSKELGNRDVLRNSYRSLAVLHYQQKNYKEAYENYNNYILYKDSLNNEEAEKKIIQSQMNYEFDKKQAIANAEHKKELQNQQVLAEEKSRKQRIVLFFVIGALILAAVFTIFILRSLKTTKKQKKLIELQKELVEKQKLEVEHQKHLVEEHQKEIIDSITYAKRIQKAILPSNEDIEKHFPNSFVLYKPKDIVAGDFYWMHHSIKDDIVLIAAADSTGHGVPGAMVSVVCSNALNRAVDEFGLSEPGKVLDKTRELVLETFAKSGEEIKDGMDVSMISLDKKNNKIKWSGANNQLCYISNGEFFEVKADKQPIGKTDFPKPFTTHSFEMKQGDIYYLITDGYADQFGGPKGKKFKFKQLQELILTTSNLEPKEQQNELNKAFINWSKDVEQVDDVTIIGVRM